MPCYEYKCTKCGVIEIFHSINDDPHTTCPECQSGGLVRLVSGGQHVIIKGRQMNQYSDVKFAKYWRDNDGNRHRVTSADGSTKSPTVPSNRKRSDAEVTAIRKRDAEIDRKSRQQASYNRFARQQKKR